MRACFVACAAKYCSFNLKKDKTMYHRFDRSTVIAFATHRMKKVVTGKTHGQTGWALYPKGFFGKWNPESNRARRSMCLPKPVTYIGGIGWVFAIEHRMIATRADTRPVGFVYANPHTETACPAENFAGTIGFLATTSTKRVRVKLAA